MKMKNDVKSSKNIPMNCQGATMAAGFRKTRENTPFSLEKCFLRLFAKMFSFARKGDGNELELV